MVCDYLLLLLYNKPTLNNFFQINQQINQLINNQMDWVRSSRSEVFCEKCFIKNFAKFTGKHLFQSVVFNKVSGLRPAALLKKRLWHRCFPVNFAKFLRTAIFIEYLRLLLLLSNITFLMRSFKDKNIQNQQVDHNKTSINDNGDINKQKKNLGGYLKTWMGIFQVGIFRGEFTRGSLIGGNFPGGNLPGRIWLNANKIWLNASKTEVFLFKSAKKQLDLYLKLKLNGKRLYPTNSWKYWSKNRWVLWPVNHTLTEYLLNGLCYFTGHHKIYFFVHKISCTQNRFSCTSLQVGKCTKLVLKPLAAKIGLSISVLCTAPFL